MKLLSSREFNRDVSHAKRAAQVEPVLITDRGQPTHVLMSIADYRRLTGEGENILELLAMPEGVALDAAEASPDGAWDHREPLGLNAMYLLDTGIVLELRKAKAGQSAPGLAAWAAGIARQKLFISALNLLEIENAAARLGRKDRAAGLAVRDWIDQRVMPAFEGRVLPVDAAVVRRRAQLPYANTRDGLLAATALEHGLTFVTHRVSAFRVGRIKLLNPSGYVAQPSDEDEDWSHGTGTGQQWLKNLYVRA